MGTMRVWLTMLVMLSLPWPVRAEQVIARYEWTRPAPGEEATGITWCAPGEAASDAVVRVDNPSQPVEPVELSLRVIDRPAIGQATYAIRGRVRCEGVAGKAYLQMWNHFPGGGRFFTRALADGGPMGHLSGTHGWRLFVLPFYSQPGQAAPERLVIDAVLPGAGRVWIGPLELVQFETPVEPAQMVPDGAWFSSRTAGFLGGGLGCLVGLLGGLIGWLSSRGRARRFVALAMAFLFLVGLSCLVIGCLALVRTQPWLVAYPFLLTGVICTLLPVGLHRVVDRRTG